ncbi:WhiB family transcriptional regulator [Streptomyces alboflavus]|uniref:WhiB family transcriptional regulator n=1 Tax=Streptomyces alboflavus TaxID=67267 RepID=UPI0007C489DA|nr:WhiB family transcriptional regulator [Streptomyces alboflavus]
MSRRSAYGLGAHRPADWRDQAACADTAVDPEIFYVNDAIRDAAQIEQARRVCDRCPVRAVCLTAAYDEPEEWGIRGGYTPRQRSNLLRDAGGVAARAVADATGDTFLLLRHIYEQHTRPGDGHVAWVDRRRLISVRGTSYTVHQLAFRAVHGRAPVGSVVRTCDREACVAADCLRDGPMRVAARPRTREAV